MIQTIEPTNDNMVVKQLPKQEQTGPHGLVTSVNKEGFYRYEVIKCGPSLEGLVTEGDVLISQYGGGGFVLDEAEKIFLVAFDTDIFRGIIRVDG